MLMSWSRADDRPRSSKFAGRVRLGLSLLAVCCWTGCGQRASLERLPVHPVQGIIKYGNEKLEGAMVVFHPAPGSDPRILPARGSVGGDGTFSVTTYEASDGAVEGEYIVTVVRNPLIERDGDHVAGPNVLPPKYSKAETSDLKVRVAAGPNQLEPLSLR
ncbi:MAG: hypothetical protein Q8M16_11345 [Pirellulaceae bacterium]|nr:hypothetical protein [Pirellulaceae bacterium]